jgi:Leucine-rich repeat (LRR) protein
LPEWSSLNLLDTELSHLQGTQPDAYNNERFTVQKCLLSSVVSSRIQLNGVAVWKLPEKFCSSKLFATLECLEITFCAIRILPPAVSHLVNLKILNVSSNRLMSVAGEAFPMLKLEFLELQKNVIVVLPESLGSCFSLKSLDVSSNLLQSLPLGFGNCKCLETLNFAENPMNCLPRNIFSKDILDLKSFLHGMSQQFFKLKVSFQDFGLSKFLLMPCLPWDTVRELILNKNSIVNVSEDIFSCLNHLILIDLSDNPLAEFPDIWNCPSIKCALMNHTQISEIPSKISFSSSLEFLDLSWSRISEIGAHVSEMPALKKIILSGNVFNGSLITLNFPICCTHIDLNGANLSSLKFQSEAKRSLQESAKQNLVRKFGKTLLRKTHEHSRVIQGKIYRDEHLSDIEISRLNETKVENLKVKLGMTKAKQSSVPTSFQPVQVAATPKSNVFSGIRCNPIHSYKFISIASHCDCY